MKSIVLGTVIAALASGCIITSDDTTDKARITATWEIKTAAGSVATCPPTYDTAALYNLEVNPDGTPIPGAQPIIDLFDCVAGSGRSAPLPPAVFQSWVEIANHNNTDVYARSLSAIVDVRNVDKQLDVQILTDGGYFQLAWSLVGDTTNMPLGCAAAGASGGVELAATVSGTSESHADRFTCDDGRGITAGFRSATYTVQIDALNSNNPPQAVSTGITLTNKRIDPQNKVTDLGNQVIRILGK